MKIHLQADDVWPHGQTRLPGGRWAGSSPRAMADGKRESRAMQLVKADLTLVTTSGIDTSWKAGTEVIHFVEAKTTMNYYALAGAAKGVGKAPSTLNGRQAALWYLLKDTKTKGLQMSDEWIRRSLPSAISESMAKRNRSNRFVHLVVFTPSELRAFSNNGHKAPMPNLPMPAQLLDTGSHLKLAAEILVDEADEKDMKIQDEHKTEHLVTDTFLASEIDAVEEERKDFHRRRTSKEAAPKDASSAKTTKLGKNK